MTKTKALALLFFVTIALAGVAQTPQPQTIVFTECTNAVPCTVDVATFTGGVSMITNDPYTGSQREMYHTDPDSCPRVCSPTINVRFATEVSDVKFSVANGWPLSNQTVVATTDTGASSHVILPPFTTKIVTPNHWKQLVLPGSSHREITIQGARYFNYCHPTSRICYTVFWDYSIDDFIFTKTPGDRRIVYGLRGVPGNEPFIKSLPRTTQLTSIIPLGAMFFARIEKKEGNTWVPIAASSQMSNAATKDLNGQDKNSLFPSHPFIAYNQFGLEHEKVFQAIHYGTATIVLRTSDPKVPTVTINVTSNAPNKLGDATYKDENGATQQNKYTWDALIMERAHRTGIPPQWIKAMVEQEAHFNTRAYRYELRTRDYAWIQDPNHQYHHGKEPFIRYRMADGPELCDPANVPGVAAGPCSNFRDLDDISPRSRYKIKDPVTGIARPIKTEDGVVTIRQILDGGNGFSLGTNSTSTTTTMPKGRRRAVGFPDGTRVAAQTTIASSYGLLQLLWCDVVGTGFKSWPGAGSRLNPTFLFDTTENHKRGIGSLNLGPSYAAYKWARRNEKPVQPSYTSPDGFAHDLRDMLWAYNGRQSYGSEVEGRVPHYTPYPSTAVSAPLCEPQKFSSQTRDAYLTPGGSTSLGVSIDGDDVTYQWFSGSTTNPIAGATSQTLTVSSSGTYWCQATTECGPLMSDPIVVRTTPSCTQPSVRTQPVEQKTIIEGATTTFGADVTGTNVRYQWYEGDPSDAVNGPVGTFSAPGAVRLAGETAPSILVQPKKTTTYFLYAYNSCGAVLSRVVTVIVEPCTPVSIGAQSGPVTITRGESTSLSITPQGTAPFTIQWYTGTPGAAVAIAGATSATLPVTPNATTTYFATISNRCGTASSTPVQITVNEPCTPASISAQSSSKTITRGESTTLSITPAGSQPRTIQWYAGSTAIGGANAATLPVTPNATTTYHATVTNDCGTASSTPMIITVVEACVPASISAQSSSTTITRGESTTLSVTPGGSTPRTIQWYAGATAIAGANAATYPVSPTSTTTYHATVTNDCGTAQSTPVTVTVTDACVPASISAQSSSTTIVAGQSTTLSITAAGTTPRSIQWFAGGAAVAGANGTSYTVSPSATTTYHATVSNACGTASSSPVTVTVTCPAPSITSQPQSASIAAGQSITLSVSASNATGYQWFTGNGAAIPGAIAPSLTVTPAATTSYSVVVTNSCGSTTSSNATVSVSCNLPTITQQPQGRSINASLSATLTVSATNATSYQWFTANGSTIAGATSPSLSVTPAATTSYYVVVTNSCGSTTSSTATVTVMSCERPIITQQPQGGSIFAGQSFTLFVAATNATSYQWFTANGDLVSSTQSVTVTPSVTTTYHAVMVNACGSIASQAATVTVTSCNLPTITQQPQDATANAGESVTLGVSVSSSLSVSYQWYADGSPIAGANGSTVNVSPSETTSYYVVVSNACGSRTSSEATVTVNTCVQVRITDQPDDVTIEAGDSATLTVQTTGDEPITYEWHYSTGAPVARGQSITVSPERTTSYYVVVSNACQILASRFVTVTVVCNPPQITEQPQDWEFTETWQSANLFFGVSGTNPTIRWYRDGLEIGTGPSIMIYAQMSTHTYHAVATSACGSVTSNAVVIESVCRPPEVTIVSVSDTTVPPGGSSVLHVNSSGSALLSWTLWEQPVAQGGYPISSGRGTSVPNATVIPPSMADYWFEVTNDCGTTRSNSVRIDVQ
jgi:uncharacterized cupredoxin-like copper-binding protein